MRSRRISKRVLASLVGTVMVVWLLGPISDDGRTPERCRGRRRAAVMPWSPRRHPWPPEERGPSSTRRPPLTNMIWNTPNWPLLLLLLAYVRGEHPFALSSLRQVSRLPTTAIPLNPLIPSEAV
ncbi:hypothetical protein AVEN_76514-1 [Araneus ventricosus]|uniref:Secreted protein n=1 Tax=Araneus ventricosus TaxID=182803 RepID=A0A4Y2CE03_ARAVE|nr:hypothetical protein AVEN_76514-1 [Araneus ventricosus]